MRSIPACLRVRVLPLVLLIMSLGVCNALAQTSAFTYQGRLTEGTTPPSGTYEMQFKLFDALTGGTQQPQPTPVTIDLTAANGNAVTVGNGIFSVQLDFGANAFTGAPRYLEISVRHNSSEAFTVLSPRQPVTSTPYAIQSLNAATADGVSTAAGDSVVTAINAGSSTINAARLPSTLATQNGNNTFSGTNTFSSANTFSTSPTFSAGLSAGGQRVTGVGTPTAADDAATKAYVDANAGTPSGPAGGHLNLQHVALLRWYEANQAANFAVGTSPRGVAYDGANIWVANAISGNVTKLRASDGAILGTFAVGNTPRAIAYDGANIWVANFGSNNVTKLRASDGANLGTFAVGTSPSGVAFDGINIWVTNQNSSTVSRL